jgi:hypothetical protein
MEGKNYNGKHLDYPNQEGETDGSGQDSIYDEKFIGESSTTSNAVRAMKKLQS